MQYLLLFHVDNGYANGPQRYIQCYVYCLCFRYELWVPLYTAARNIFGAFKYTEHLTKRCYRAEAQHRSEFLKCKSPVDCKVQVSSFTVTVTICWAGDWATASERSSNGRTMLANRPVGTEAVYSATSWDCSEVSSSQGSGDYVRV